MGHDRSCSSIPEFAYSWLMKVQMAGSSGKAKMGEAELQLAKAHSAAAEAPAAAAAGQDQFKARQKAERSKRGQAAHNTRRVSSRGKAQNGGPLRLHAAIFSRSGSCSFCMSHLLSRPSASSSLLLLPPPPSSSSSSSCYSSSSLPVLCVTRLYAKFGATVVRSSSPPPPLTASSDHVGEARWHCGCSLDTSLPCFPDLACLGSESSMRRKTIH